MPEEAKTKPYHHGWCGAPFYSPECGPDESDEELVGRTAEPEEAKTKPCHHGWCGAPFCSPECGPHGSEEVLAERAADDTDNIEEADRDTAALPPPGFLRGLRLVLRDMYKNGLNLYPQDLLNRLPIRIVGSLLDAMHHAARGHACIDLGWA